WPGVCRVGGIDRHGQACCRITILQQAFFCFLTSTTRGDFVEIPYQTHAPAIRSGLFRPRPASAGGLCPFGTGPLGRQHHSDVRHVLPVCGVFLCLEARGCVFL